MPLLGLLPWLEPWPDDLGWLAHARPRRDVRTRGCTATWRRTMVVMAATAMTTTGKLSLAADMRTTQAGTNC